MSGAVILLRVFSGPHLGAELPLPPGEWVIGTDDSCDLILRDATMCARHAALTARDEAELDCVALDGPVNLAGGEQAAGPLPPETLFAIGGTLLAWIPLAEADSAPERWQRLEASLAARESGVPVPLPEAGTVNNVAAPLAPVGGAAAPAAGWFPGSALALSCWSGRRFPRLALLLVALALGGLLVSVRGHGDGNADRADRLNALFGREDFPTLTARADADPFREGVTVSGTLRDDAERARLLYLVQSLQYPVYLEVSVRTDRTTAIERGFGIRGLSLQARESVSGGKRRLTVAGYVRDGRVEDWAFAGVWEDLPTLLPGPASDESLELKILHEQDVARVLEPALARAGMASARIAYLPGKIELSGPFTFEQSRRLTALLAQVQRELGIPVPIEVRTVSPWLRIAVREAPQGRRQTRDMDPPAASGTPEESAAGPGGFTVVGVTLKPLPFVSLKNGQRIFEGGLLPGGWTLESIDVNELKLVRGGQSCMYPLRGNS